MAQIGDRVRFLNSTGGGVITRIEGKMVYVDDEGFETPMLLKDVVVVLPAGHEPKHKGASIMFDQEAFDAGRKNPEPIKEEKKDKEILQDELPIEETSHGEKPNIVLAFEPADIKRLSTTRFSAILVNDSNFFLDFIFLRRSAEERGWTLVFKGNVAPNELIDLAAFSHENLPEYEKVAIQCIAYKKDKVFTLQPPVSVSRKLDLTKFHKLHCFRPGIYFDSPVLEIPLVKDGVAVKPLDLNLTQIEEKSGNKTDINEINKELSKKYKVDSGQKKRSTPVDNPRKILPLIEVDLHIGELTDSTSGMEPKDMLELQLDTVKKYMNANRQRIGQKIVFIHGKGEGVLRKAVLELLKKEWPKAELQDASFREYGFGATLVTIH